MSLKHPFLPIAFLVTILPSGCKTPQQRPRAELFEGLDFASRSVTTRSPEAQRYFDQGFALYQGFNLEEARRSFESAAAADPLCAMAQWGIALSAGPHINNPTMDEEACRVAADAIDRAQDLARASSTAVERDLIFALARRYSWPPPADRTLLDQAYAAAMREVHAKHPRDPDVAALFAVALLETRPWGQWTPDGQPSPETPEIVATLEEVLASHPRNALANHAYIHAVEASPSPEKALPAANRLRDLPSGAPHLVHMPSHIDLRVGHYADAVAANQRAIDADRRYVARVGRKGFYTLYRAHNYHFLVYAAMFDGRSELALRTARELVAELPLEVVAQYRDVVEGFLGMPLHVLVRFGKWNEILSEKKPAAELPATLATWHYARGMALAALGRVAPAEKESSELKGAIARVPATALFGNNTVREVLQVAQVLLEAEIAYRRGRSEAAFALLHEAARRDDGLKYDEPWGWPQPVRHALGALLLEQGKVEDAEAVYREDLKRHPENGWALTGLAECLKRRGSPDAAEAEARAARAWARADLKPAFSCYCRTGAVAGN